MTARRTRALASALIGSLALGTLVAVAAPAAQGASATVSARCQVHNTGLAAPDTYSLPLTITVSPATATAGRPVTVKVTSNASPTNTGPTQLDAGKYRFDAGVSIGATTVVLAGVRTTHNASANNGKIFTADELPIVASGAVTLPTAPATYPVVLRDVYFNNIDEGGNGSDEGLTDTFDLRCNSSTQPNTSPAPFATPRASVVAQAPARPDVRAISASDITIKSGNCKYTSVRATWANVNKPYELLSAFADITKNGKLTGLVELSDGRKSALWCPYTDGVGKFVVGPTDVAYWDPINSTPYQTVDRTTGVFHARYASKTSIVSSSRSGSKVTLKLKASRYKLSTGYVARTGKATVQYKSGSKWQKVKTVKLKKGKATATFKAKKKRTYRIVLVASSTLATAKSKTVKR